MSQSNCIYFQGWGLQTMRIVLADDQINVRSALRLLLEQVLNHQVVGEADQIAGLLGLIEVVHPDLLMLDWELPNWSTTSASGPGRRPNAIDRDVIRQLRTCQPQLKVVVLSGRPEARQAALMAGADAFVSKNDHPSQILEAIRQSNGR